MGPIEIFETGRQTSESGETSEWSEELLDQTVSAYDPDIHEAPIVVGHPKANAPAYGWISKLERNDSKLVAETRDVMPEFSDMVKAGRFRKRSASFYLPDAPSNPVPGTYYLRHVGFLGAQPPAVKGLADPAFNESDGDVVCINFEDGECVMSETAVESSSKLESLLHELQETISKLFSKNGQDQEGQNAQKEQDDQVAQQAQSDQDGQEGEDDQEGQDAQGGAGGQAETASQGGQGDDSEDADADQSTNEGGNNADHGESALNERLNKLERLEQELLSKQKTLEHQECKNQVEAIGHSGRLTPAQVEQATEIAFNLSDSDSIKFSEGPEKTARQAFIDFLNGLPMTVNMGEYSRSTETETSSDNALEEWDRVFEKLEKGV